MSAESADPDFVARAQSLGVIAHPTRLRIAFALLKGPASAKRLAFLAQATTKGVFYHLAQLERAGIVSAVEVDRSVQYSLCGSWADLPGGRKGFQIQRGPWLITLFAAGDEA
jgi:DNA-binding transcriptional ArsR family regulator